jgi:hypothetical protein
LAKSKRQLAKKVNSSMFQWFNALRAPARLTDHL